MKATTKATKPTTTNTVSDITISSDIKKQITQVINAHNAVITKQDILNTKALSLFNIIVKESISLRKQVIVHEGLKDESDYKYNKVSKALKEVKEDSYYHSVVDTAIKYLKSGYSVMFLDKVRLSLVKKLIDIKPTKASVKATKDNKELEALLNETIAKRNLEEKKAKQALLSEPTKDFLKSLSSAELIALSAYFKA